MWAPPQEDTSQRMDRSGSRAFDGGPVRQQSSSAYNDAASAASGLSQQDTDVLHTQMSRVEKRVKRMETAREGFCCGLLGDDEDQAEVDASMEEMRRLISASSRAGEDGSEAGDSYAKTEEEKHKTQRHEKDQAAMDNAILTLKSARDGHKFKKVLNERIKSDWLNYDALHGNIYRVWAFGCLAWPDNPGRLQAKWYKKQLGRAVNQNLAQAVFQYICRREGCCEFLAEDLGDADEVLSNFDPIDDPEGDRVEVRKILTRGCEKYRNQWVFSISYVNYFQTVFKLFGCWAVLFIQVIGPFATAVSCLACWGIDHADRYNWRKFWGAVGADHYMTCSIAEKCTRFMAALFIFAFNLNGWFIVGAEGGTWAKVHRVFKFLNCHAKTDMCETWLILGAWINCFAVFFCCLCVPIYVGDSETVLDVFMDSLALLFLFNLDDVGGDLGFVSEQDWPGWELSWVYETKLKKRREPQRAIFQKKCPFVSWPALTSLMYQVIGFVCMILAFVGPFFAIFVNWNAMRYGSDEEYMRIHNVTSVYASSIP